MPVLSRNSTTLECRRTPWDERVFECPCAEITSLVAGDTDEIAGLLADFDAWALQEGVQFAYGRFPSTAAIKRALPVAGFYFAEASFPMRHTKVANGTAYDALIRPGPVLEPAVEADYPAIREILAADFEHGRFHEDPWVEPARAALRYQLWLDDLVKQEAEIFVYRLKGRVIGLHIQRATATAVDMVLTGVTRSHALLGASLWAEAMRLNRLRGVRELHTMISAANIPILNLYRRFEFQFGSLLLGFHKRYQGRKAP